MHLYEVKQVQYDAVCNALLKRGRPEPYSASFNVSMRIDEDEYLLRIQPERGNRLAILQAQRIERDRGEPRLVLLTRAALLASLLEILIEQTLRSLPLKKG